MIVAIFHHDLVRIKNLLAIGFDPEMPISADLRNSIEVAIEVGHIESLKVFKKFGANFYRERIDKKTYLHH